MQDMGSLQGLSESLRQVTNFSDFTSTLENITVARPGDPFRSLLNPRNSTTALLMAKKLAVLRIFFSTTLKSHYVKAEQYLACVYINKHSL